MKRILALLLTGIFLLNACASEKGIEVHNAWARPAAEGDNGAVYFELHNHSSTPDELVSATTDIAETVEFHESKMDGDVMQMKMLSSIPLEAFADVDFAPGELHLMLVNLKQELRTDDTFEVVLHFKNYEDITVKVSVRDSAPEEDHKMD